MPWKCPICGKEFDDSVSYCPEDGMEKPQNTGLGSQQESLMAGDQINKDDEQSGSQALQVKTLPAGGGVKLTLIRSGVPDNAVVFVVSPKAGGCIIGRFDADTGPADIDLSQVPGGVYVSRKHARIFYKDGAWHIEDLGSTNGTFIKTGDSGYVKLDVKKPVQISTGTTISFGNVQFIVEIT